MKNLYVKDLQKNLILSDELFLIASVDKAEDKNGKEYYKLILSDKTGRVEGKIWSDSLQKIDKNLLKPGILVAVSGKVDQYKNNNQINVIKVMPADESAVEEFMESSEFNAEDMFDELIKEINLISHQALKDILLSIANDSELGKKLKYWPAGNSIHHGFRSGMLQHILEMIYISKGLKKFYPNIDYDVLTAGIILHDIGKLEELGQSPTGSQYSKTGSLLGHITIGVLLFHDHAKGKITEDLYLHICHLILSHHGTLEFGSPVFPSTIEAVMLTYIDNLSSKARTAENVVKRIPDTEEFSDFCRWLYGVKLWKGGKYEDKGNEKDQINEGDGEKLIYDSNAEDKSEENLAFDQLGLD